MQVIYYVVFAAITRRILSKTTTNTAEGAENNGGNLRMLDLELQTRDNCYPSHYAACPLNRPQKLRSRCSSPAPAFSTNPADIYRETPLRQRNACQT